MKKELQKRAFTLIELMVVVIIISILAGLAIPQYYRSRERAIDKQAQEILKLIRAAERNYKLKAGVYWPYPQLTPVTDVDTISENLTLDLVDDGTWGYSVQAGGGGNTFIAELYRNQGNYNRRWRMPSTLDAPFCDSLGGGGCP